MDQIIHEVDEIELSLYTSRRTLRALVTQAQRAISAEVDKVRGALKQGDHRIDDVVSQVKAYLWQLEDIESATTTVNMQPQMAWLTSSLNAIVKDLDSAKISADSAISCTNGYTYSVMDVAQKVESNNHRLCEISIESESLAQKAQSDLQETEEVLASTKSQITRKEAEIKQKVADAATKRERKKQLDAEVVQKRRKLEVARQEKKSRKEESLLGAGLSLLGIAGAPFTGGASLALTFAGSAVAGYKVGRLSDFQQEINTCQSSVSTLNASIAQNTTDVASLERDKCELEATLCRRQLEILENKEKQQLHQRQIKQAEGANSYITTLRSHAASTKANVTEALPELKNIKSSLEECSILVQQKSIDVTTSSTVSERLAERLPIAGSKIKKSHEFKKQKILMIHVGDVLDKIHQEIPLLLSGQTTKFLDTKSWKSAQVSVWATDTVIPNILFH